MKTVPTMQSKAYCWNCQQFLDADDLKQSSRNATVFRERLAVSL
jgi:hypothetical protein